MESSVPSMESSVASPAFNMLPNGGLHLQQAPQWRSGPSTGSPMEVCTFNMLPNGGLRLQHAPQWRSGPSTGSPMGVCTFDRLPNGGLRIQPLSDGSTRSNATERLHTHVHGGVVCSHIYSCTISALHVHMAIKHSDYLQNI